MSGWIVNPGRAASASLRCQAVAVDQVINAIDGMYLLVSEAYDLDTPIPEMPGGVGFAAAPEICYVSGAQIDDGERVSLSVAAFDDEPDTRPWDDFWTWKASTTIEVGAPLWISTLEHDQIGQITDAGGAFNVILYVRPYEYLDRNPDEPAEDHFLVLWPSQA